MSLGTPSTPGRRTFVLLAAWLVVFAGAAGSAMSLGVGTDPSLFAAGAPSDGPAATSEAALSVDVARENATLVYRVAVDAPSDAARLRLDGAFGTYAVAETDGFVADDGGYRLAADRDRGTLTARLDLSESRETALGTVGPGGAFQAGDDWAFAPSPRFHVRWVAPGESVRHLRFADRSDDSGGAVDTARTTGTDDAGGDAGVDESAVTVTASTDLTIGERFVLLGPHSVERRTVDGQRVRVVVPAGTEFAVGADRAATLLGAVQNAAGTRADGPITTFVLPEQVRAGGASSGADAWVRADAGEVTVAHEYVHASLSLRTTAETRWLREASAEYLAYRVAGEPGAVESLGASGAHDDATLADPATWESWRVPYEKGAATLAELDERLRNATDGEVTVGRLVGRLSTASRSTGSPSLTHDRFVTAVGEAGGDDPARWADAAASTAA